MVTFEMAVVWTRSRRARSTRRRRSAGSRSSGAERRRVERRFACGDSHALRVALRVARAAAAEEHVYIIVRSEVSARGFTMPNHRVVVADLGYGVDGLLGINFLRHFNLEIRFAERCILVEKSLPDHVANWPRRSRPRPATSTSLDAAHVGGGSAAGEDRQCDASDLECDVGKPAYHGAAEVRLGSGQCERGDSTGRDG